MKFFAARMTKSYRRGSALVLALVLTIALFIMGLAFVSTTQIEKETIKHVDELQTLETIVDVVIDRINNVLVDDLIQGDKMLDGKGDSKGNVEKNECWDYPGPDDPWLASLEPYEYGTGTGDYRWRRISDIYNNGINNVSGSLFYDPVDRNNPDQWDSGQAAVSDYYILDIGTSGVRARIVADIEGTETIVDGGSWDDPDDVMLWGARADADGDGVADSRWVKVPNLTGPRGQNVYTAVRIVDNCGMININTAFRDPSNLTTSGNWDGSRLSHINIEGVNKGSDNVWNFQLLRLGGIQTNTVSTIPGSPPYLDENNYNSDKQYDNDVSQRILNPAVITIGPDVYHYTPLDIMDELELRNRGFVDSPTVCRLESLWTQTFLPGYPNSHLKTPYDDYTQLPAWFVKASEGNSGYYTRRHICTTYSFDRVIVPKPDNWDTGMPTELKTAWGNWTGWNLSSDKWSYRPVCVNDYNPSDPCSANLKQIAAAIWLGLPDNTVISSMPQFNGITFANGNARDHLACQMAVNMLDYIDTDNKATDFNPSGGADHYYGYEYNGENPYISMIAVALFDTDKDTPPSPEEKHYAVEIYNPGPTQINLSHFTLEVATTPYVLPDHLVNPHSSVVLVDSTTGNGFTLVGVVDIGHASFAFTSNESLKLIDHTNNDVVHDYIADIGTVPAQVQASNVVEKHEAKRSGLVVIDGGADFKFPIWPEGLGAFSPVGSLTLYTVGTKANEVPIQLAGKNAPFTTMGELFDVLSIGTMDIGGTCHTMPEFWERFYQTGAGDPCDIAAGRIDMSDPCFADFPMRYFSVFQPFNDTVDNDGDGKTDEKNELAVAGRININTAPWFVIAQLPWFVDPTLPLTGNGSEHRYKLARAIVAYRDMARDPVGVINYSVQSTHTNWASWVSADPDNADKPRKFGMGLQNGDPDVREEVGFANIAELLNVTHNLNSGPGDIATYDEYYDIRRYGRDKDGGTPKNNNESVPHDPDPGPFFDEDDAANDLNERDVIFQRVSNLVTVRSDVFTAYIMVRVGEVGPQKRVIAIFDRSNVYNSSDIPKLVAVHPVPDPR